MATAPLEVKGVVLCRVGAHRLAFAAGDVASVDAVSGGATQHSFADVREAFALPAGSGRALIAESGSGIVVDTLEVHQDAFALMPVPPVLRGNVGKSLRGFVQVQQKLWPVFELAAFSTFMAAAAAPAKEAS